MYIIFLSAPPKYSPGEAVMSLKNRSVKAVFSEFPEVREELYGGEFWNDRNLVSSVCNRVAAEVIIRYRDYHDDEQLVFDIKKNAQYLYHGVIYFE